MQAFESWIQEKITDKRQIFEILLLEWLMLINHLFINWSYNNENHNREESLDTRS